MIPAHLLDLVQPISFHPTVMIEPDGGAEGVSTSFIASNPRRIEALFSDTHRSRRTTPVTKATSGLLSLFGYCPGFADSGLRLRSAWIDDDTMTADTVEQWKRFIVVNDLQRARSAPSGPLFP